MILEGFEIENWSCIKKVSVSELPATGVIVIHGPNRTGKSSIVQALRACLMDNSSTTTALKSWYPRGTGEKPVVTVTFQARGTSYRIMKHFGTSKSELASKTATGAWKVETTSAADAHERTCRLVGGSDSAKGLHQLLWLTQAEFRLPEAKKFDPGVQAQLRGILGVLQTPLDDRFIERVKKRWSVWFGGQRKAGRQPALKEGCKLAENLKLLEAGKKELEDREAKFKELEGLLRQAGDLEQANLDLNRRLALQIPELKERQEEQRRSETRIFARQQAEKDHAAAEKEQIAAFDEQQQRAKATKRCLDDARAMEPTRQKAEIIGQRVKALEAKQTQQRSELGVQRDKRRELQTRANGVAAKLRVLDDAEKLETAEADLVRAREIADAIGALEKFIAENPAPDKENMDALKANQRDVARLQSECNAVSMQLTLTPETGAAAAQVALDGGSPRDVASALSVTHTVRRKAELKIGGWGRIELSRGTGQGDLDQMEDELRRLQEDFASAVAPFGIAGNDPNALNQLIERDGAIRLKNAELEIKRKELKQLAPKGLEPLQVKVRELQTKLRNIPGTDPTAAEPLPALRGELESLSANLREHIASVDEKIDKLEEDAKSVEANLAEARRAETTAKEDLASCKARANSRREELERLRSDEQITQRIDEARRTLEKTLAKLGETELTSEELSINERLHAAQESVGALQSQSDANTRKLDIIKGRLLESEGLHAQRSSLATRVDELTRLTQRESLERDAVDRLYALFEECREKQLGTLMGPIHDRVLGWMRILDIGDYQQVRFNDAFLPDKMLRRDGTAEFELEEESTGAQEQIGMLVRLALGSILAAPEQSSIAIFDDPLTHCDLGRLNKMRIILRRAAEGDPNLNPPAGALQILVFTCHPEGFRDERAKVIDLEDRKVMIPNNV